MFGRQAGVMAVNDESFLLLQASIRKLFFAETVTRRSR
jgi:hypothetical protein